MPASRFDFDVITGPSTLRADRAAPRDGTPRAQAPAPSAAAQPVALNRPVLPARPIAPPQPAPAPAE